MECFLCKLLSENSKFREKREEIKKFSKKILLSCKTFSKARIHHKHKYKDVILPESWDDELIGYHSSCYKEFRVKSKYLFYESSDSCLTTPAPSSTETIDRSSTSSPSVEINPSPSTSRDNTTGVETSSIQLHGDFTQEVIEEDAMDCSATVQSFDEKQFAKRCFLCKKIAITRKGRKIYCREVKNKKVFLEKFKTYATELGDIDLRERVQEELNDDDGTCLYYHNNCSIEYFAKYQSQIHRPATTDWALKRDCHKIARERLIGYIEREVIENQRVLSLAHLKNSFSDSLIELYETANLDANIFSTTALKDYIKNQLKNKISIVNISQKPFVISAEIDIETLQDEEIENIIFEQEARDFALKYRPY